jgi:DNA polymerase-3 subunit gamma/tau
MNQPLALAFRPRTLDQMIGAAAMTKKIRGRMQSGREPAAWMFSGLTGSGKTTAMRIIALSLQCRHQEVFGNPCDVCYEKRKKFDITEINASDVTKKDDFQALLGDQMNYSPFPGSRRKVIILDELHRASDAAQNYLLKPFEDCPQTTVWMVGTTAAYKILETLRRRCASYVVPPLDLDATRALVKKAMKIVGSTRDPDDLVDALLENGIFSPGLILNAVEKYLEDKTGSAEDAIKGDGVSEVDVRALNREIFRGSWRGASKWLQNCNAKDAQQIRYKLANYFRQILLDDVEFSDRNDELAEAIKTLVGMQYIGDESQVAGICAVAYQIAKKFKK